MAQLSAASLPLVSGARVPRYDRGTLRPGLVHLGVGAFHRCHQAEYTEDLIEAGLERRGITGINLVPPHTGAVLAEQDGLYSRTILEGTRGEVRVIGCLTRLVDAALDPQAALRVLADPVTTVVTLTVTEKGYCHLPATGRLDPDHADAAADMRDDGTRTVPGLLAAALAHRRAAGAGGLTLVSCDNIPANGVILRAVTTALALARDPLLARWIDRDIRFPSTMVDRIVPASGPADLAAAAAALGVEDRAAVGGEAFRQWVVEDDFAAGRPAWDAVGATFVRDVRPYELVKMRVLNAAQTAAAALGLLLGLETSREAVGDPMVRAFLHRMLAETRPTLPGDVGIDLDDYAATSLRRISNAAISHRNVQIATDASQKIVQRLLDPIRERLAAGSRSPCLAAAVAAVVAVRLLATARFGARLTVPDPISDTVEHAARLGDAAAVVAEVLGHEAIFGDLTRSEAFRADVSTHVAGWLGSPREHLAKLVA